MKSARYFAPLVFALLAQQALADSTEPLTSSRIRPFIGGGYTLGGNTIFAATIIPKDSSIEYKEDISAGAGLDLRAGVDFQLQDKLSLQAAVAYHNDQTNGSGGTVSFHRVPVELIAHWRVAPTWRLGLGARRGTHAVFDYNPKVSASGSSLPTFKVRMKMNTGLIVEGERFVTPNWSFKLRYVKETVRVEDAPDLKYKGDHFGLITAYYFD